MSQILRASVLIIGAGAAGIAAGRTLHDAEHDVLILEAHDRIGGRVYTDSRFTGFPLEIGAEFIHGDTAVTHQLVRDAGLNVVQVVRMDNLWWGDGNRPAIHREKLLGELSQEIKTLLEDYDRLSGARLTSDLSLADYLHLQGWDGESLTRADVLLAQTCCATLETLSCYDIIREERADHAGSGEARIREGYGALFDWYSRELPIQRDTPIDHIIWGREGVIAYSGARPFHAQKCIITVPVSVLQANKIYFDPPLSDKKQEAIAGFRMEAATKLFYQFREQLWDDELTFMAHTGLTARWWTPRYHQSENNIICSYITAGRAREIDSMSEQEAVHTGLNELCHLLGISRDILNKELVRAKRIAWAMDAYALGGYAHVPPGFAQCRPILAAPEQNILFFGGEATAYETNPQTVHGAIESGWRAAHECMAHL